MHAITRLKTTRKNGENEKNLKIKKIKENNKVKAKRKNCLNRGDYCVARDKKLKKKDAESLRRLKIKFIEKLY